MSVWIAPQQLGEIKLTNELIQRSDAYIRNNLDTYGITFEGKALPVSFVPTLINERDLLSIVPTIQAIRKVLNGIIDRFILEHSQRQIHGPLHNFFRPYSKWWDIIAMERRTLPHINLMRYDTVLDAQSRWSLLETNTACPGGTIHCARIRKAWLASAVGRASTQSIGYIDQPIDSPDCFVRHMMGLACTIAGHDSPNIALCTYKGCYPNELASLKAEYDQLKATGAIRGGNLVLCDIRELSFKNGMAYLADRPIHLIHNKLDPLMIDPEDPEIAAWVKIAMCDKTQFLNGLGAFYLTETKRIFALLSDPVWRVQLDVDDNLERSIGVVPFTTLVDDWSTTQGYTHNIQHLLLAQKDRFVLKADALTRGAGVTVGSSVDAATWLKAIQETCRNNGVVQKRANTPSRYGFSVNKSGDLEFAQEYFGIDLFLFGDKFVGPVSRCHTNLVFNIGNGGKESPTLVVRDHIDAGS